jgi:hypothetical protein
MTQCLTGITLAARKSINFKPEPSTLGILCSESLFFKKVKNPAENLSLVGVLGLRSN